MSSDPFDALAGDVSTDPFQSADVSADPMVQSGAVAADPFEELLPTGNLADAIVDPLTSLASSGAGQVGAGARTLYGFATGEPVAENVQAGQDIQETMDEFGRPSSKIGAYSTMKMNDLMNFGLDVANMSMAGLAGLNEMLLGEHDVDKANEIIETVKTEGVGKALGNKVFELTQSPWMSAVAETTPEILSSIWPVSQIVKHRGAQTLPKQELAQRILDGDTDGTLAKYIVDGSKKLRGDPVAIDAVNAGLDQGFVAALKGMPETAVDADGKQLTTFVPYRGAPPLNPTKQAMLEMLDIKKKGMNDRYYRKNNRPSDVAGRSAVARFNHVKEINQQAGKEVAAQAELLKGEVLDFTDPINKFSDNMLEMGITLDDNLHANFKGSVIEELGAPENAVRKVVNRVGDIVKANDRRPEMNAHQMHMLKQYIDEIVTFGKGGEGLSGKAERIIKQLRTDIDDTLDGKFPAYDEANQTYSETITAIDELQSVAGSRMDLSGKNADRAVGILMRRILSNAGTAVRVTDALDMIDEISKKHGGDYADDLGMLVTFNAELDDIFGSSADHSFKAEITSGVQQAMADKDTAKKKVVDIMMSPFKPDEKEAFEMIRRLIEGRQDPWTKK